MSFHAVGWVNWTSLLQGHSNLWRSGGFCLQLGFMLFENFEL